MSALDELIEKYPNGIEPKDKAISELAALRSRLAEAEKLLKEAQGRIAKIANIADKGNHNNSHEANKQFWAIFGEAEDLKIKLSEFLGGSGLES